MELLGIGSRVKHPAFGDGVVIRLHPVSYEICFIQYGVKTVAKDHDGLTIVEALPAEDPISLSQAEQSLKRILVAYNALQEVVPLGDNWNGGKMILQPGTSGLQSKEVPIDVFFNKIVMMRDRLRVLEQQINASKKLDNEEKVNLQQYITRCYGSMTTFNLLFKNRDDYFVGQSSKGE